MAAGLRNLDPSLRHAWHPPLPVDGDTARIYSSLWRDDLAGSETRMREAIDFEVVVIIEEDL